METDSTLGEGTTISIYLPKSPLAEDQRVVPDFGPIAGGTGTILVAEVDARVRESVVETPTELGYHVLQVPDATSALAVIKGGGEIDLLFTDVVMPGRLKSPKMARMPRVMLPNLKVLLAALEKNRVDILMTNIGLPDLPGTRLAAEVRGRHPNMNIIFATGHVTVDGFPPDATTAILTEPCATGILAEAIRNLVVP